MALSIARDTRKFCTGARGSTMATAAAVAAATTMKTAATAMKAAAPVKTPAATVEAAALMSKPAMIEFRVMAEAVMSFPRMIYAEGGLIAESVSPAP